MNNYTIRILNQLSPTLRKQTEALRYLAFHKENITKEQQASYDEKFTFEEGCFMFVITFLNNQPVGYMRLFKRPIHFKGKNILLGGVGGVCTHPDMQRKGIATKMLHTATQELKKIHCDVAYLCTNIDELGTLYEQVGFVPLKRQHTYIGRSGKRYWDSDGMIAPISSQTIFKEILQDSQPFDLEGMNW